MIDFQGCISNLLVSNMAFLKEHDDHFSGTCGTGGGAKRPTKLVARDVHETTTTIASTEDEDTTTVMFNVTDGGTNIEEEEELSIFSLWVVVLPLMVVLTIAYYVKKYLRRHTGVYETREDAGEAEALDADTAVLHSKTGHLVEKKQEWFF